jgi:D-serine deaminase-like pyridoxal phosphate-dependent protein
MRSKLEIPTPALLLDLDAFEANLRLMADRMHQFGKRLRPHAKAHKCVEIARRQVDAGAIGVCVATVAEAELMSSARIPGLLLTSPLADPLKMARVAATGAMVVVDHVLQVDWYNAAARSSDRMVDVLIDLDVGDHRTGASAEQAIEIAKAIGQASHLRYRGLQGYSISGSHTPGTEARRQVSEAAFRSAVATRNALPHLGLTALGQTALGVTTLGQTAEILTGGSTGTWDIDSQIPEVTELQAGSYVLMDLAYSKLGLPFRRALTVLTTVISANHDGFVTVDGGFKAFSTDRGYGPEAVHLPGSTYRWGGDEFGYLDCGAPDSVRPKLGDKIEFIAPHCDPTVNLYDRMYVYRREVVEGIWPVKAADRSHD